MAVLLNRPHPCNRTYFSETVNDADGLLVNAWRSIQLHPDATAEFASWPVLEADKHARQIALVRWREERQLEHLMGDPRWCDPEMAGWWVWGVCCQIGAFAVGDGAWTADETGRIFKQDRVPREPGVSKNLPHLSDNGLGVNRPVLREPGVVKNRPHLGSNGQGINRPVLREPGVLSDDIDNEFHPMTMPELRRWFQWLSARLRHVRILNGDCKRLCTSGALKMLEVRFGKGHAGIFLDPPYADTASRADNLYASDSLSVAHDVREWCLKNGDDPAYRIVLAGYDGEHGTALTDAGWREVEWFTKGFLKGGMAQISKAGEHQQHRERLWMSPNCLDPGAVAVPTQSCIDWD
jgi:hypothetical protein